MSINNSLFSESENPIWKDIVQKRIELKKAYFSYWLENNVFSLGWWLMVILFVALFFIWWKRVDKTRLHEIITYGLMVAIVALFIDIIGCEYVLWGYPTDLAPLIPPLIVTDFCFLPIIYMLLYQYFTNWKSFTIAAVIISAFIAFIAEEIAVILDLYEMNNWKHLYSFPMYILLALALKWVMNKIIIKQNKSL